MPLGALGWGGLGGFGLGGLYGDGLYGYGYGLGLPLGCGGCGYAYKSKIGKNGKTKRELVYACDKNKGNAKRCFGGWFGGYGAPLNWGNPLYLGTGWGHGLGGWGLGNGLFGDATGLGYGLGGLGCGGCGWAYKSKIDKDGKTKRDLVYACDKNKKNAKRCFGGFGLGGFGGLGFGLGHGWGVASRGYDVGYPYFGYGCFGCGIGGFGGFGGCGAFYRSKIDKNGKTKRELVYGCPKREKGANANKRFVSPFAIGGYGAWPYGGMSHNGFYDYGSAPLARTAMSFGPGRGVGVDCSGCGWAMKSTITKGGKTKRNMVYRCDKKAAKKHGCFADLHAFWDGLHHWGWGGLGYGGFGYGGLGGFGLGCLGGACGFGGGCGFGGYGGGWGLGYYRSKVAKGDKASKRNLPCVSPITRAPFAGLRNRFNAGFGPYARGPWWGGYAVGLYPGLGPYSFGVVSKSKVAKGKTSKKCGIGGCGAGGLGLGWGGYQGPSGTEWGYPGSGFGTYPPRFPWMKAFPWARSKIKKDEKGDKRGNIPTKKQTIHLGYGYASGDNYRLGFGFGGMGGLDPFQTLGSHVGNGPGGPEAQHVFGRSHVPKQIIGFPGNAPGHFGAHFGGHGIGPGYPGPGSHPVTHPGFSTMGYPGHAIATLDIKKVIMKFRRKKALVFKDCVLEKNGFLILFRVKCLQMIKHPRDNLLMVLEEYCLVMD